MNALDLICLAILAFSLVWAVIRGFIKECLSLAALILGLILASRLYSPSSRLFDPWIENPSLRHLLGFLLVLIIVLVLAGFVIFITDRLLHWSHLKWIDRILGGIFGLLRGWLVITVLILAATTFNWPRRQVEESVLAPYLLHSAQLAAYLLPRELKQEFDRQYQSIYQHWLDLLQSYRPDGRSGTGSGKQK